MEEAIRRDRSNKTYADPGLSGKRFHPRATRRVAYVSGVGPDTERLAVIGEIAAEIAHELRNVLQVISASAYLARQESAKGDVSLLVPHVAKIERNARVAHAIVDDLMALARGDVVHTEPTPVVDLVVAARADFHAGAARWSDTIAPPDLRVRGNAGLLTRVLRALYENAIQVAAPRAPAISTRAWDDAGRTTLEIADDGPGVPEAIAPRLFEPLVSARPGGTGLGLALARRVATAHGATIELVPSTRGATFRLVFPAHS
jgi:two-component system sensor histidine kinase PilS (NtrC family)